MAVPTRKEFTARMQYQTETHDGHVRINVTGQYDFDQMIGLVQPFRDATVAAERTRLLVDCTRMEGRVAESDKFFIAQKIAAVFRGDIRSALLMPRETITKLGEMVAVNRGAHFFVTDSEPEALEWLLETKPEK
jgi:hypothetical protein